MPKTFEAAEVLGGATSLIPALVNELRRMGVGESLPVADLAVAQ